MTNRHQHLDLRPSFSPIRPLQRTKRIACYGLSVRCVGSPLQSDFPRPPRSHHWDRRDLVHPPERSSSSLRFSGSVVGIVTGLNEQSRHQRQVGSFHGPCDKLGTMRNIHRWALFFVAIGIALWISSVSPQLGIIIFAIGLVGLVIAWVIR